MTRTWRQTTPGTPVAVMLLLTGACAAQDRARASLPLRAQSTEIVIPFTPVDRKNHIVTDLHQEDIILYDNGAQRPLTSLVLEDGPASIIFLLDVSGSMKKALTHVGEAVERIVRNAPQEDEFGVIEFSDEPIVSVEFTRAERTISSRLRGITPAGRTSLVDSTLVALQQIKQAHHPRKAIVIITDGQDNHSRHKEHEVIRTAMETDVRIYSIELYPPVGDNYLGKTLLEILAENTGGRYLPTVSPKSIPNLVARIDAHRFYRATFSPLSQTADGKPHSIELKFVRKERAPGAKLFWRRSYQSAANTSTEIQ